MKPVFKKIAVVLTASCLAIAGAEFFLRAYMPIGLFAITSRGFQAANNPNIAWELKPNVLDHNALGLRDHPHAQKKPDNTFRILVAGDSIAYGLHVPLEEIFSIRLEKKLNAFYKKSPQFDVINMGVPGYRLIQIVERLKEKGFSYEPDLIVYCLCLNDSFNSHGDTLVETRQAYKNNNKQVPLTHSMAKSSVIRVALNSQIVRRCLFFFKKSQYAAGIGESETLAKEKALEGMDPEIIGYFEEYFKNYSKIEHLATRYEMSYASRLNFARFNKELKQLASTCKDRNLACVLVITPLIDDFTADGRYPFFEARADFDKQAKKGGYPFLNVHKLIASTARQHGFTVLDLQEAFQRHEARKTGHKDKMHPTGFGHEVIARELYEFLMHSDLLNIEQMDHSVSNSQ